MCPSSGFNLVVVNASMTIYHRSNNEAYGLHCQTRGHQLRNLVNIPRYPHSSPEIFVVKRPILWHYGQFQLWMLNPEYSSINIIECLPDMTSMDPTKVNLLIINDLMPK